MIRVNHPEDADRISTACSVMFHRGVDMCISRVEGGELYGGVIFQGYTGASIAIHMAGFRPNWANRDVLWAAFHYPFVQLGCRKLFGQVPASNKLALEIDLKLGFKEEARISDVYPDGDMIVLAMYKEDCRWLSLKPRTIAEPSHGRQSQSTPSS